MEQNNFEKNVQQKMDEFKIAPSDSVWTNVEKRIDKKEKDRKVIFILFFLIVFLLSGGYWLLNLSKNKQKSNQQISSVIEKKLNSKETNKADSSSLKYEIDSKNVLSKHDAALVSSKKIKTFKRISVIKNEKGKYENYQNSSEEVAAKRIEESSKERNKADLVFQLNTVSPVQIKKENDADQFKANIESKINADALSQLQSEKKGEKLIVLNDLSKKNDSVKTHKQHWNIGFTFSGGESSIERNLLQRSFPVADYVSNMPSGGIPSYYFQPSPIKNSTAFIIGAFIEKNISARGKIALGLSYKYYSLLTKVGKKIDSLLSPSAQYFSVSNSYNFFNSSHTYRNNFHYLEVPVSFELQLNKNRKLPLSWQAGVDISELIGSNALQFESNPGIYYHDNSMFNKTQFGVHTGLFATLFSKQKVPFSFGPYFYYSASSLAGSGFYNGKHFSFIGIRTQVLFKKK
ncbi:MAG: hypothetical protein ACTHKY_06220 [Ginsengibacter sp.]